MNGNRLRMTFIYIYILTSDRETTIRMRVESSVPSPFMLFHSLSAKKPGRPRAHNTREKRRRRGDEGREVGALQCRGLVHCTWRYTSDVVMVICNCNQLQL